MNVSLSTRGTDFSNRAVAAKLRHEVIEAVDAGHKVTLDLVKVRSLSYSFADELFGVVVADNGEEWFRSNITIVNASPWVRSVILEAVAYRLSREEDPASGTKQQTA